jgi:pilus assembly protein CpaC
LTCGSGQEASFQAGGELPIPKTDQEGRLTIAWKPYGIILQIAPTVDPEGIIHTRIRSEVSMVDQANAVDGIPGILTRRIDTHLSLKLGQTIVLSGLVHSDDAERITKIPFLGNIPILGEIFKSRSFQKRETEMVVFLSPLKTNSLEGGSGISMIVEGTYQTGVGSGI